MPLLRPLLIIALLPLALAHGLAAAPAALPYKPIIYFLNSYHPGYAFSDDEMAGFREGLGAAAARYDLRFHFLDA